MSLTMNSIPRLRLVISATLLSLVLVSLAGCFQVQNFGPVAGAEIAISPLHEPETVIATVTTRTTPEPWAAANAFLQLYSLGSADLSDLDLEPDTFYLLTATGGTDVDCDQNLRADENGCEFNGTLHAIYSGKQIDSSFTYVSPLTEAVYQTIASELAGLTDTEIGARLDELSYNVVTDLDNDGVSSYDDIKRWSRLSRAAQTYAGTNPGALDEMSAAIAAPVSDLTALATEVLSSPRVVAGRAPGKDCYLAHQASNEDTELRVYRCGEVTELGGNDPCCAAGKAGSSQYAYLVRQVPENPADQSASRLGKKIERWVCTDECTMHIYWRLQNLAAGAYEYDAWSWTEDGALRVYEHETRSDANASPEYAERGWSEIEALKNRFFYTDTEAEWFFPPLYESASLTQLQAYSDNGKNLVHTECSNSDRSNETTILDGIDQGTVESGTCSLDRRVPPYPKDPES